MTCSTWQLLRLSEWKKKVFLLIFSEYFKVLIAHCISITHNNYEICPGNYYRSQNFFFFFLKVFLFIFAVYLNYNFALGDVIFKWSLVGALNIMRMPNAMPTLPRFLNHVIVLKDLLNTFCEVIERLILKWYPSRWNYFLSIKWVNLLKHKRHNNWAKHWRRKAVINPNKKIRLYWDTLRYKSWYIVDLPALF